MNWFHNLIQTQSYALSGDTELRYLQHTYLNPFTIIVVKENLETGW